MASKPLSRAEVSQRLIESEWRCSFVKDMRRHALWHTAYGFYFSVAHDCTEDDLMDIWAELVREGKKRNT